MLDDDDYRTISFVMLGMVIVWTAAILMLTADEFRTDRQARPVNMSVAQPGEFAA